MGSDSETEKIVKKTKPKPKPPSSPEKPNALSVLMQSRQNKEENKPKKPRAKKESGATTKKETVKKETKTVKRPKPLDDSDDDEIAILSTSPIANKKARTQRDGAAKKTYHISDDDDLD